MLDFEVVPENSLSTEQWEFVLGMHFCQAVSVIQERVGVVRDVHVSYSDKCPLDHDLMINLSNDGIRLIFDPDRQQLKMIEVYNMSKVRLRYGDCVFNSPQVAATIQHVDQTFGATHPGIYDGANKLFLLNFRGLTFFFAVEPKFEPKFARGLGSLQFSAATGSPLVSKMCIYSGSNMNKTEAPPMPLSCYHGNMFIEQCDVIRHNDVTKGVKLLLRTPGEGYGLDSKCGRLTREVYFGYSCQDVASLLGAPSKIFYKSEDKMKIHSPFAHKRVLSRRSDFFYNYFTLGMDILFDARSNLVKKIILHTNFPGHYNFNIYYRCRFCLTVQPRSPLSCQSAQPVQVTTFTRWDDVCDRLKSSSRPVVLSRASSTNTHNPFGSTLCYGVEDFICEVMGNGHLASVILYQRHHQQQQT